MDKELVTTIREILRQELEPIKKDINNLQGKVDNLHENMENLQGKVDNLKVKVDNLEGKVDNLEEKVDNLKKGQEEIKNIISELELKNANRHFELTESIDKLRKNLSTVEEVTAKNWTDIIELKKVK